MRGTTAVNRVERAPARLLVADADLLVAQTIAAAFGPNATAIRVTDLSSAAVPIEVDALILDGDPDPETNLTRVPGRLSDASLVLLVSRWSPEVLRVANRHAVAAVALRRDGLPSLLARVRSVAGDTGRSINPILLPSATGRPPAQSLTDRELEVGDLISRGLSNEGIAAELGLSVHTVRAHVRSILAKLGVAGRFAAAQSLRRDGHASPDRRAAEHDLAEGRTS